MKTADTAGLLKKLASSWYNLHNHMLLVSYEQDGDLICDDERGVA